jgi:geranylgeranyl diphosphate synthase type II
MHSLTFLRQRIEQGIAGIDFNRTPAELYQPISYILEIGGKRMRPALCLLACDMFGGDINKAISPAIGIELFHNFTLLHDDIMDKAPMRRGQPTVHHKWNNNIAILSGDTMMALSYEFIMKSPENCRDEVFSVFNRTAIEVCEGQQFDMNFETRNDVSIDEYLNMIRLKTAVLLGASLKIGAIIGNASVADRENLYHFGENIGTAFQLKDDLLDVFGSEDKFGKKPGGDIIENKKTFLSLKAFELAKGDLAGKLADYFTSPGINPDEKISGIRKIYETLNLKQITLNEIEHFYQKGLACLEKVNLSNDLKSELILFAGELKNREN